MHIYIRHSSHVAQSCENRCIAPSKALEPKKHTHTQPHTHTQAGAAPLGCVAACVWCALPLVCFFLFEKAAADTTYIQPYCFLYHLFSAFPSAFLFQSLKCRLFIVVRSQAAPHTPPSLAHSAQRASSLFSLC